MAVYSRGSLHTAKLVKQHSVRKSKDLFGIHFNTQAFLTFPDRVIPGTATDNSRCKTTAGASYETKKRKTRKKKKEQIYFVRYYWCCIDYWCTCYLLPVFFRVDSVVLARKSRWWVFETVVNWRYWWKDGIKTLTKQQHRSSAADCGFFFQLLLLPGTRYFLILPRIGTN